MEAELALAAAQAEGYKYIGAGLAVLPLFGVGAVSNNLTI